jgi:hypothetical protein
VLPVLVGYSRERFGMGVKSVLAVSKPNAPPFAIIGAGDGTVQAITASLFSVRPKPSSEHPCHRVE